MSQLSKIETFIPNIRYLGRKKNEVWFYEYQETENGYFKPFTKKDISMNITNGYFFFTKEFGNLKIVLKTKSPKVSSSFLNKIKNSIEFLCL